ncbi:MAG TPA: glycoside hydrolase family 3 protein [Bauldia sp.]|nr:glycoside hydrolase family 3 protein [Bauldia sp.]
MTADSTGVAHPERWPEGRSPVRRDPEIEAFVAGVLGRMTVEEKVGQIIQADIGTARPEDLLRYPLGSILNGGDSGPNGNDRAPAADWLALADAFYDAALRRGGTWVPLLWGIDAVHGNNNIPGATLFPHNIGLGATRDRELVRQIAEATAVEIRATGMEWSFAPSLAVARDDRWGRTYESYSEDPEIVADFAGAMVEGLQGRVGTGTFLAAGKVLASAKHFLGDGGTTSGKDQGDNPASEEELRDIHGRAYTVALAAGAQTVMASFSSWRGAKMHGNRSLLTSVLKERMGFDGFVVGDWAAHSQLPGRSEAHCPDAINAGLDMFMSPFAWRELFDNTLADVRSGTIPMARLDDAVTRILRVKARLGLFRAPRPSGREGAGRFGVLGSAEHRAVARRAVRQSLVLLKNAGGVLPIHPGKRILVAGAAADSIPRQSGGWTLSWQGTGNTNADFPNAQSILAGLREAVAGGGQVIFSPDGSFTERPDIAVAVFGEVPYAEFNGDLKTTDYSALYPEDLALLRRLTDAGVPVVSVFISGRPLFTGPEIDLSDAFVAAWLPGSEGGGIADLVIAGPDGAPRHDFRGKLGFSWPRFADQVVNRGDPGYAPLFPYGYGLTYR